MLPRSVMCVQGLSEEVLRALLASVEEMTTASDALFEAAPSTSKNKHCTASTSWSFGGQASSHCCS